MLELSCREKLEPMEKDLGYGGLSLQILPPSKPDEIMKIGIKKVFPNLKSPGTMREQSFYIYAWELPSFTDVMVGIVEGNNLKKE